jgi:hypothetical protein
MWKNDASRRRWVGGDGGSGARDQVGKEGK